MTTLYYDVNLIDKGKEISFVHARHGWPVTVLTKRVSGDFEKPIHFAVDFFGWHSKVTQ